MFVVTPPFLRSVSSPSPDDANRVTRNAHMVTPGETNTGFGDIQAFFPLGALVNHSCQPNSCFHSMVKASPGGQEVDFVLRTTLEVRAGNELCISYIVNYATSSVAVSASLEQTVNSSGVLVCGFTGLVSTRPLQDRHPRFC